VKAVFRPVRARFDGVSEGIRGHVRASPKDTSYFASLTSDGSGRSIEDSTYIKAQPACTLKVQINPSSRTLCDFSRRAAVA
jgi:hypothetical protein